MTAKKNANVKWIVPLLLSVVVNVVIGFGFLAGEIRLLDKSEIDDNEEAIEANEKEIKLNHDAIAELRTDVAVLDTKLDEANSKLDRILNGR